MTLIVQIIIAAVAWVLTYLCGKFGIGTQDVPATATTIGLSLGAVLAIGASLFIKWLQAHKISTAETVAPGSTTAVIKPTGNGTLTGLFAIALLLPLFAFSGCALFVTPTAATPQDQAIAQVNQAMADYIIITTPIDVAISQGDIKGNDAKAIQAAEAVTWSYLAAAETAAKAGTVVDSTTQLQLFRQAEQTLITAFAKAKPAATQPG